MTINIKGHLIDLQKPLLMGILNFTPDSFYQGSRVNSDTELKNKIQKMFDYGADIIDVGGMSSRPGAKIINEKEELKRLESVFKLINNNFADKYFSIDTIRSSIAKIAVKDYGISIINDISGGEYDNKMFETVAECKVPYVMMHMKGTPENMQDKTDYKSLTDDIILYFSKKMKQLNSLGVNDVILDPGFGFSKTIDQNFELLNKLEEFEIFNLPILAGLSRKSMIWRHLNTSPDKALNGTSVLNTIALQKGADILRVHDVKEGREVIDLFQKTISS